jgi:Zn-dependent M28 family amino/carboxypeptidase
MQTHLGLALLLAAGATAAAQAPETDPLQPAADRMLEHIRVLSSDPFEGRKPGSAGEDKSVAYLQGEYSKLGLLPGNPDGSYIQDVPMVGVVSTTQAEFDIPGAAPLTPAWINDYVAVTRREAEEVDVKDSGIVFVGYGVVAPEYGWDDFKGVDVRGKTVVMLINDPPVVDPNDPTKLDDKMFKGKEETYYGRWTYKYEEASAMGAAACLIVHETGPAGYPFAVIAGSWGRENFDLKTTDGNIGRVKVEGWLTLDCAKRLFTAAGYDFDALKASAAKRNFHPVEFKATASFSIMAKVRTIASRNVVARLEGSDPAHKDEYVIYSAHWDHLGKNPLLKGDPIFHGAADNASGTAGILEIARAYTLLPAAERPKRSILFISTTAEEQGLLGARYYALHPLYPLEKTLADINLDGMQHAGPSRDLQVIGFGNTTLEDVATDVLAKEGRVVVPDLDPAKGYFFRNDEFEFAKVGLPAIYTSAGYDIVGKPAGYGKMRRDSYTANDYHKPSDVIKDWWDLRGAALDADTLFQIGLQVAQSETWPQWKPGSEFKARRDAELAGAPH